ncbi:MAG: hypothetical protein OXG78_00440 [Chloroflexi bacterium]|nr:hypothetical protein [Chloroflexota bacterium]
MTATAVYSHARANIESLRATATVVRARMKTTLEYAGTRVAQAEDAAGLLRFSLISLGTDTNFVETSVSLIESFPTVVSQPSPADTRAQAVGLITSIPPPTDLPVAAATAQATNPQPVLDNDQPRLENIVMASGVDDYDCAVDSNPVFTPQSAEVYVVAEAFNVAAGATISSRWYRRGTEVAYFSFQAENDINGNCIWFFIDQTDTAFTPGSWSVEIRVDDIPIGTPIAFLIADN